MWRCIQQTLRVHVPNNWVLGMWVIVLIVQVWGKYIYDYWVLGPLGEVLDCNQERGGAARAGLDRLSGVSVRLTRVRWAPVCPLQLTLRVTVPSKYILTQNLYYHFYYPQPKYQIIRYTDPLGHTTLYRAMALVLRLLGSINLYKPCGSEYFRIIYLYYIHQTTSQVLLIGYLDH